MRGAPTIDRALGRELFGADPAGYAAGRPPYPERVYEVLRTQCRLRPGAATFEIGPGTGLATRRIAVAGAGGFWPFALEREARTDDLLADGFFEEVEVELMRETLVLDELVRIAESEFAGRVERQLVTALYSARRTQAPAT